MTDKSSHNSKRTEVSRWTELINQLEHWPSNAPEWDDDEVQDFVYKIQSIAEQKCRERVDAGRFELQYLIVQFMENYRSEFAVFDIDDTTLSNWASDNCPIEFVSELTELIKRLVGGLEQRTRLKSSEPKDFKERQKKRKDLSDLEEEIYDLLNKVDPIFEDSTRDETPGQSEESAADVSPTSEPAKETKTHTDVKQESDGEQKPEVENGRSGDNPNEVPISTSEQIELETSTVRTEPPQTKDVDSQDVEQSELPHEDAEATADVEVRDSGDSVVKTKPNKAKRRKRQNQSPIGKTLSKSESIPERSLIHQVELEDDSLKHQESPKNQPTSSDTEHSKGAGKVAVSDLVDDREAQSTDDGTDVVDWEPLGWDLLESDDWTGAYWLARSLKAKGLNTPVPHELLAVLQGSRWLEYDKDVFVTDILQIASEWSPQKKNPQRLLGLAAALRPCLIAPHTGLVGWLPRREEINPGLGTLCDVIREFSSANYPLRTQEIRGIAGRATRGQAIEDLTLRARTFLTDNLEHRLMFQRATKVLHRFVRLGGDLHSLLIPVIQNQPEQIDNVRHLIENLSDRKQIVDRIDQIDRDKPNLKPIIGPSINQLVRIVDEAVGIARRWCDLNEQEYGLRQRGDWWDDHVNRLLVGVRDILPAVKVELETMLESTQSREDVALGYVLKSSIGQVTAMLGIDNTYKEDDSDSWMRENCLSLTESLTRRLLYIPEIKINEVDEPSSDREDDIGRLLRKSIVEKRNLSEVIDMWIEQQDFRFTEVLQSGLDNEELSQEYGIRCNNCLKESRLKLENEAAEVRNSIEKGIVDGLLNEEERTTFSTELETATTGKPLHFQPLYRKIRTISKQLNQKLEDRMRSLNHQWKEYKDRLTESNRTDLQLESVTAFFDNASMNRDTRVMEEGLTRIQEYLQGGTEWNMEWFEPPDINDVLVEFKDLTPAIDSGLSGLANFDVFATKIVAQGQSWKGMNFGELPKTRRDEARESLRAWHQLKRRRGNQIENRRKVKTLMAFLGFHISDIESAVKIKNYDKDWIYCQITASSSDLARPIPQMGSQANGRYDVVCMWESPGASSIRATLSELKLDKTTVVVFYLGRLSDKQRHNLANMAKNHNMTLSVLDEILLVFLARSDDNRLPDFMRCSLPYAAFNPYMPFHAGNVPPEMFYGREDMIRQILQNEGSCMVYGGRQLGKSALLRKVEREFHQPEREQYAWVEDIKLIGEVTSGEHPTRLWIRLRDGLKNQSLLGSKITTTQPEAIIKHIRQVMNESTQRRVLVLFDEADNFLGADAQNTFQVVEGLRSLMQDTQLRFKVVFAGLHDVQRFYNIANQPLAHFGLNLRMGPLEPGPAQQLVREPLEVLGFRFVDDTTVLKVLSYTNYHPGLIQYFCYELVGRLQSKKPYAGPPFEVCSDDVESVYRSVQVRKVIRERLDWTLALDPRYQCIAWTMICEQKQMQDISVNAFTVNNLLQLVRYWWNEGFREVDSGDLRILLEEMVGLGILARKSENEFQLRSPNLVRLMGTEEVIEGRLLDLGEKPFPPQFQPTRNHSPLDHHKRVYSPLTLSQEGSLKERQESGITLVFGSRALGISRLNTVFKSMDNSEPIPQKHLTRRDQPDKWMVAYSRTKKAHDHLLTYGRLTGTGDDMARCVWSALKKCDEFKEKERRPMRVVFILDPVATWSWLRSSKVEVNVETICLRRWDEVGIQQRLKQADKLDSLDICTQVRQGTGGWPLLLDELFDRCIDLDDPRACVEAIVRDLETAQSELRDKFLQEVGLDPQIMPTRVFRTMVAYGKIPEKELGTLAELVEGTPSLTTEECKSGVEYLSRMGCVDRINGEYRVDSVLARIIDHI